jgi:hypothetical protein
MTTKPGGRRRPKSHLEPVPAPEVAAAESAPTATPTDVVLARVRTLIAEVDVPAGIPARTIGLAEAGLVARQLGERTRVVPVAAVLAGLPRAVWDPDWVSDLDALGSAAKTLAPIVAAGDGPSIDPVLRVDALACRRHLLGQARHHLRSDPGSAKTLKRMGGPSFAALVSDLRSLESMLGPRLPRIGGDPSFRAEVLARAPELADAVEAALEAPRESVSNLGDRLWGRLRTRFHEVRRVVAFVEESLGIDTPLPVLAPKRTRVGPAVAAERAARKEAEAAKKAAMAAEKEAAAARKQALASEKAAVAAKKKADREAARAARRTPSKPATASSPGTTASVPGATVTSPTETVSSPTAPVTPAGTSRAASAPSSS